MNEEQIQAILDRVDARVDARVASMMGNAESVTPIAFEQKWMDGYHSTMPIDQALFRRFLRSLGDIANKTFKTIGGVSATQVDDALIVTGTNGIAVSSSGKIISVSGSGLMESINALAEWNNSTINIKRIGMWMRDVSDTPMDGMYIANLDDNTNWYKYWIEMRSRIGSDYGMWVAFNTEHLCFVSRAHVTQQSNVYEYAIHVPFYGVYMIVEETRGGSNDDTVKLVVIKTLDTYDVLQ